MASEKGAFVDWSNSFKKATRPRKFRHSGSTYIRTRAADEIEGKQNIKRAKREKVRKMKLEQQASV